MFVLYVAVNSIILYKCEQQKVILNNENTELKQQLTKLKVKVRACDMNSNLICSAGSEHQGSIRYIDCGESFVERWATCFCTTMCLEDFTVVITNRRRCRYWEDSVPIQIRPESEENEEENEEED